MVMSIRLTMRFFCFLLGTVLLTFFFNSCKTAESTYDPKDLSYLYNPIKSSINPAYNVNNQTDNRSLLSIRFLTRDLFFSEANASGIPTAQVLISVKLFNISQAKILVDTAVYNLSIIKEAGKGEYVYNIPLSVEKGMEYMSEIRILDRLRLKVVQAFVPFNTLSPYNRYNFITLGHFNKNLLFDRTLRIDEYINILYTQQPLDSLFISFYKPFKEVPDPPSMPLPEKTLDYDPETVVALPYSDTLPMMYPRNGIYFISAGRDIREGLTLLNLGESYPAMNTPEVMIEPLAYLATPQEISMLKSALKPKLALDNFWIKCGGNVEKARELIRIYYTRVLYSNLYFTSYKEGWRTERGMIYIIYGPPDKVYKTDDGERWGYKKPVIKSSWGGNYSVSEEYIFFNFKKKESIFSDNDFFLSRSETLVTYWDRAITSWKNGIVFRLDNPEEF
jgi:GWxTD domain-containing protein